MAVEDDEAEDEVEWEDVDVSEECEKCNGTGVINARPPRIGPQVREHYIALV